MDPVALAAVALAAVLALALAATRRDLRASYAVASRLRREVEARTAEASAVAGDRDQLLEGVGPGVLAVGEDLRIVGANATAEALLGRARGTLGGRTVMEAFLDATAEDAVRTAARTGNATAEIRPSGPDGPAILLRARRRASGGSWLFLDDVSELRRLQRIRTEFIDNLSHELRTPITTVSLLAETLAREADVAGDTVPARMRERIDKIEVETGHLVQMVSEIMDLSRIESGGPLDLVDGLDLGRVAADSAERLRLFAERQGVDLRIEAAPGMPAVRGDAARLGQVVVNLLHNAVKFSPDGGEVVVRTGSADGAVTVSVKDHGIGIPKSSLDRVFERFYKVDRARLRAEIGGGTGLGLAIARHVIEQHGGRIGVVSEEGVGSTFSFTLPSTPVEPPA